jgi:hypothetical protein
MMDGTLKDDIKKVIKVGTKVVEEDIVEVYDEKQFEPLKEGANKFKNLINRINKKDAK